MLLKNAIISHFLSLVSAISSDMSTIQYQQQKSSVYQQPSAPPAPQIKLRNLKWGKINFIHTTDTHAWYAGHLNQENYGADWGDYISFVDHLKAYADKIGVDVLVFDSGDKHDGNGLSDATDVNGEVSTQFFAQQQFDLLSIGNHELYLASSSYQEYELVAARFHDRYLAANVQILINSSWHDIGSRYRLFETKNQKLKVLGFGFLFNFKRFNPQTRVRPVEKVVKESWFHDILESNIGKIDMIVVVGHIPVQVVSDFPELLVIHRTIRKYYPDIIIQYFGGHSHIRDFTVVDDRSVALQSGRYCETVGFLGVDFPVQYQLNRNVGLVKFHRRYIDFNLHSFYTHSNKTPETFPTLKGQTISLELDDQRKSLGITKVYGHVPRDYLIIDNSYPGNNSLYRFLETDILTRLIPDGRKKANSSRVVMINSGSIRYDLYKGPFTKDTMFIVSPFQNKWLYLPNVSLAVIDKVTAILNNLEYILSAQEKKDHHIDLSLLGPVSKIAYASKPYPVDYPEDSVNLTKGYVTCDDHGCDGDDTPHIPYAIGTDSSPNIVRSTEVKNGNTQSVDLVFYDFLQPYIVHALDKTLGKEGHYHFKHYGGKTVGNMLKDYVMENWR